MPQIILGPQPKKKLDGSVKKAALTFLEKLQADDTAAGLHIEPISQAADPRIRTGRVNDFWRAVLVKMQGSSGQAHYVYLGTFPHDDAIAFARTASVQINPRNGIAELIKADQESRYEPPILEKTTALPADRRDQPAAPPTVLPTKPLLLERGVSLADLLELGLDPDLAERAVAVQGETEAAAEDALLEVADSAAVGWQGLALVDIASGTPLDEVAAKLALPDTAPAAVDEPSDDQLLEALQKPAALVDFAFIENDEELRAAIEDEDFGRWRVFLHPEQRSYAYPRTPRNGAFRLTGGAGTGKTVVLIHRARDLARKNPDARIILTTFNRTLANQLVDLMKLLDPDIRVHDRLGEPGVMVAGIDQIAHRVLRRGTARLTSGPDSEGSVAQVLGARTAEIMANTPSERWNAVIERTTGLPNELRSAAFFQAEYATVVLPNQVTTLEQYLHVRRPGRGTALSRSLRRTVWEVIEGYRASAAANGSTDFEEKARIAALDLNAEANRTGTRYADHVLVDEGQDLSPSRLHLVRALVEPGPDDLFLAEDSQQRIYGQKVVLSRYGINIRGRSRRLTLNYRTTAQVLRFAVGVLSDEQFTGLEDDDATIAGYRSARSGPPPRIEGLPSLADEYTKAAELITTWVHDPEDPTRPETIGLLVRNRPAASKLVNGLAEHGVDARFVEDEMPTASGKPLVMTMHRSKGMEFRKVILFDVSASTEPTWMEGLPSAEAADAHLQNRSLVYVAATRARDVLAVIWRGAPSPLLPVGDASAVEALGP